MNSQRKCGAQGAAVLLQEFLWLGECAARSSCHAYHPGYKMIIEKDIHMIWHSQNGIHMFFFFSGYMLLTFEDFPTAGQRSGRGLSTSLTRWPAMGSTRSLWFGSMTGEPPMKARAEKTAAPPDWCCYVRLCVVLISENLWRWALLVFN
jgi:hypothetical protein